MKTTTTGDGPVVIADVTASLYEALKTFAHYRTASYYWSQTHIQLKYAIFCTYSVRCVCFALRLNKHKTRTAADNEN